MTEIASNYANALFSLKSDEGKLLEAQKEIKELRKIFYENPDFTIVLSSSYLSNEEKEKIIDETLVGVDTEIKSLIKIVVTNHRAQYLVEILDGFNSLVNESRGVLEGLVYSAEKLTEKQLEKLTKTISEVESRPTELRNLVDPTLIGGVKVVINDHIYDGSIKHHVENMKLNLLKKEV